MEVKPFYCKTAFPSSKKGLFHGVSIFVGRVPGAGFLESWYSVILALR
jgi:hypothetical protein